MPKAIFSCEFNFDKRPKEGVCICVQPSDRPQDWPQDLIDAAIAAGAATLPKVKKSKDETEQSE